MVVDGNGSAYVYDPRYNRIIAVTRDGELRPALAPRKVSARSYIRSLAHAHRLPLTHSLLTDLFTY